MINKAIIIGNITKDIELRKTQDNKSVCSFTIACQRNFKKQDGSYDSDFINCIAWSHTAEYIANYAKKGDMLAISGRIQTRNYKNQEGNTVYVTEIVCEDANIVKSREAKKAESQQYSSDEVKTGPNIEIEQDELPFY